MSDPGSADCPAPPLTPEMIADLHAGILPTALAEALWTRVRADSDAKAVVAALDQTAVDIHALGPLDIEPMPDLIAARLRKALHTPDPPMSAAAPQKIRSSSSSSPRLGLLAAAAATVVVLGTFLGFDHFRSDPATPDGTTAQTALPEAINLVDGTVPRSEALAVRGGALIGRLTDPRLRSDCLSANGYAEGTTVLGARSATVGSRRGTLLLIPGDRPPIVIALVLGDRCSASNPDLLAVTTVTD